MLGCRRCFVQGNDGRRLNSNGNFQHSKADENQSEVISNEGTSTSCRCRGHGLTQNFFCTIHEVHENLSLGLCVRRDDPLIDDHCDRESLEIKLVHECVVELLSKWMEPLKPIDNLLGPRTASTPGDKLDVKVFDSTELPHDRKGWALAIFRYELQAFDSPDLCGNQSFKECPRA